MPRSVFLSYHHGNDQSYCDSFRNIFCNDFTQIFTDRSLRNSLDSEDPTYIDRTVREQYIHGSSVTIVLCGYETPFRKYIDWEISDTLLYDHALLGVILPTCESPYNFATNQSAYRLPPRLQDNLDSGYAHAVLWTPDHVFMRAAVEQAINRKSIAAKRNTRPHMQRNSSRRGW